MTQKIYFTIGVLSLGIVIVLILRVQDSTDKPLLGFVSFFYALFVASLHGLIAHSSPFARKSWNMFYPVLMGILFGLLIAVYIYFILPQFVAPFEPFFGW